MALREDVMRRALWTALAAEASRGRRASARGRYRGPLWSFASRTFGLGSTAAAELCRDLGFDPDTAGEVIRERGWEPAP